MDYRLERRRSPRQLRRETLFAQLGTARRTVRCLSTDLSGSGLRIRVEEGLAPGAELDLWLRLAERGQHFLLRGRVRWFDAARGEAGVAVVWAEGSDYWEWQAAALD